MLGKGNYEELRCYEDDDVKVWNIYNSYVCSCEDGVLVLSPDKSSFPFDW